MGVLTRAAGAALLLCGLSLARESRAASFDPPPQHISVLDGARDLPLDSVALLALVSYTGFKDWKWGSASFRFNSEGWFGASTGSGGLDKAGHAYGAYMTSELLYFRLSMRHGGRPVTSLYPALFGTFLYQYIEFFDGFSVDHGYSYEDVIMNQLGVTLSLLRHASPRLGKLLDYRLFYYPSGGSSFRPMIDYEGQKFFGVLKVGGIPGVERTPLRYLELLAGYYTRGFPRYAQATRKSQHVFVGVGLSLSELIFKPLAAERGEPFRFIDLATNYFQSPLYVSAERQRGTSR
jgi:Predicted periplasmic lipoprotein (DUF2279)